jgi:hypothetical protein
MRRAMQAAGPRLTASQLFFLAEQHGALSLLRHKRHNQKFD